MLEAGDSLYQHSVDQYVAGEKIPWTLTCELSDNLEKSWLMKFVEHRVADPRVLRLMKKWKAGVMEEGNWPEPKAGSPQGSMIPLWVIPDGAGQLSDPGYQGYLRCEVLFRSRLCEHAADISISLVS